MHDPIAISFSLEAVASTSANYLERLVDGDGLPYFNVFATQPPSAAHDWPDHGDVLTRQLQAAVMLRQMTGRRLAVEDRWRTRLIGAIDPADGLFHRPARPWCKATVEDCALHLYALTTLAVRLRVPDFVDREALRLAVNGVEVAIPRTVEVTGTFLSAQ